MHFFSKRYTAAGELKASKVFRLSIIRVVCSKKVNRACHKVARRACLFLTVCQDLVYASQILNIDSTSILLPRLLARRPVCFFIACVDDR